MDSKAPNTVHPELQLARRLTLAVADMEQARSYLRSLHAVVSTSGWPPGGICDAAMLAVIVVYARPFMKSHSSGRAASKLDPEALQLFAGRPALKKLHEQLMGLRNQAIAHADWQHHRTMLLTNGVWVTTSTTPQHAKQDLVRVYRLVRHVQRRTLKLSMGLGARHAPTSSPSAPRYPPSMRPRFPFGPDAI
jgi:hypothetical protein